MRVSRWICAMAALCALVAPRPASAQIADNIAGFTEANTQGYLEPLRDTFSSGLSDGLFTSAHMNSTKPYFRLELHAMVVKYGDDDRTFTAQPEDYFSGGGSYDVPTVVGSETGLTVTDPNNNTTFAFPGGFNLDGLALAAPQLVVGGFFGSEAVVRYFTAEVGTNEVGNLSLFGIGGRHSISQYFEGLQVDIAASVFYHQTSVGEDLINFDMLTYGVQASKRFPWIEPYAGFAFDQSSMTSEYDYTGGGSNETIKVEFDSQTNTHFTLGTALRFGFFSVNGEINFSEQTSYALGLALGV